MSNRITEPSQETIFVTQARGFALVAFFLAMVAGLFTCQKAESAEQLHLREGVSFTQDLDSGFPIEADNLEDYALITGKPTMIFFGAAGDLNTNRQAKRFVDLYNKYHTQVKFLIVDVDHLNNPKAKALASEHYKGYIPSEVLLDRNGRATWSQVGEIESTIIAERIEKMLSK